MSIVTGHLEAPCRAPLAHHHYTVRGPFITQNRRSIRSLRRTRLARWPGALAFSDGISLSSALFLLPPTCIINGPKYVVYISLKSFRKHIYTDRRTISMINGICVTSMLNQRVRLSCFDGMDLRYSKSRICTKYIIQIGRMWYAMCSSVWSKVNITDN